MKYKLLFWTVHISLMDTVLHSHFNLHPLNFLMTLFSAGTITGGADNKKKSTYRSGRKTSGILVCHSLPHSIELGPLTECVENVIYGKTHVTMICNVILLWRNNYT